MWPASRQYHEENVAAARAVLGRRLSPPLGGGQAMSLEEAVEHALEADADTCT